MAQIISPVKMMTVTQDGECHLTITLELNINVNSSGDVVASLAQTPIPKKVEETDLEIPDFLSGKKVTFGKKV